MICVQGSPFAVIHDPFSSKQLVREKERNNVPFMRWPQKSGSKTVHSDFKSLVNVFVMTSCM